MHLKLREVREAKFLTQMELAELAAVSETTVVRLEAGTNNPRISTIRKLAAALGVKPTELVVNGH